MRTERYLAWVHAGNQNGLYAGLVVGVVVLVLTWSLVLTVVGAIGGFAVGKVIGLVLLGSSGRAAQVIYAPAAAGRYADTHSNIDALEARGDFRGAVNAWEAVAVSEPSNPWPLIRAGELYLRALAEPATAVERFRHATGLPGISPEQHRYASQKVIDLYLGPLRDEGRAMVEMRRLIDHHPQSREAEGARAAIRRLKSERHGAGP